MDGEEDDQRRLADHFRRPTQLHFSKDHLDFGFRALDMSNARYPTAVRTSVSRKLGFLTRRKRYEDFADPAIEHAMCWPNERVEDGAQIGLCDESEIDFTFVNAKRELARRWFSELTLSIAQARKPLGVLVFGDPGTGKSTLLKYLIQTHRPHSDAAGVI